MNKQEIQEAMADNATWQNLPYKDRQSAAEMIVGRAYNMKGMMNVNSGEVYHFTVNNLIEHLNKKYPTITVAELTMVVDAGTRGELTTKDTFVNLANIELWLKAYWNCPERLKIVDELFEGSKPVEDETTAKMKDMEMYNTRMKEIYAVYCETGDIFSADPRGVHCAAFAEVLYNMMEQLGQNVTFTPESDGYFRQEAEQLFMDSMKGKTLKVDPSTKESYYKAVLLRENMRYQHDQRAQR